MADETSPGGPPEVFCAKCSRANTLEAESSADFWICSHCGQANIAAGVPDTPPEDPLRSADNEVAASRRALCTALNGLAQTFSQMSRNEEKFDRVQHIRTAAVSDIIRGVAENLDGGYGLADIRRGLDILEDMTENLKTCPDCSFQVLDATVELCPRCGAALVRDRPEVWVDGGRAGPGDDGPL